MQTQRYNDLESTIVTGLHNIGVFSEANLIKVTNALKSFVLKYQAELPNLNFLYVTIQQMADQFYMNKSKMYTIDDAINELKLLNM